MDFTQHFQIFSFSFMPLIIGHDIPEKCVETECYLLI